MTFFSGIIGTFGSWGMGIRFSLTFRHPDPYVTTIKKSKIIKKLTNLRNNNSLIFFRI
jgi:hypothetical protein